jgi:hypothetical protein
MEAACFSETSVDFQRTTRRYIPEDNEAEHSPPSRAEVKNGGAIH